jgi:glycosyltransferase involved in cell wall biosynthesis
MRVLSIGTDKAVFDASSSARARQSAYATQLGQLDIVVAIKRPLSAVREEHLSVYPAASSFPFIRAMRVYRVACALTKPDVVSVQDPFEVGLIGYFVARHFRVPLHVQVHTDFLSPEYVRGSLINRVRVRIAGFVLRRAARVRVVSERIKTSLEKRYHLSAPVTVLPIFVDVERFHTPKSDFGEGGKFESFSTKLLVVSRLENEKNVELALRSFALSAPKDACLIILGEGSEQATLEKLATELKVRERVFFEGRRDPAPYYRLADILLVPSRYEGYGMVIVEALAAGKPVLSTDIGIAREAGAIVTEPGTFAVALVAWFKSGPRTGTLKSYPYADFDGYVRAYCSDIAACTKGE